MKSGARRGQAQTDFLLPTSCSVVALTLLIIAGVLVKSAFQLERLHREQQRELIVALDTCE